MSQLVNMATLTAMRTLGSLGCFLQKHHYGKSRNPEQKGRKVHIADLHDHTEDIVHEAFAAPHGHTENLRQLGESDDQSGGVGKADYNRVR